MDASAPERTEATTELSHYIVVADMKSRSIATLENEILGLGTAVSIAPQVWALSTEKPINAVRTILMQELGKIDRLFVVDASHDKIAWFNYSPEAEARVRRIWSKPERNGLPQFQMGASAVLNRL